MRPLFRKTIRRGIRVKVLVVDDSVVIRRLVAHALGEDPKIEVVGAAANGNLALAKMTQVNPDVVTLDIEMPEMDGLETLKRLRADFPDIRVVMFSTLTKRGASASVEALMLGADDYVTKEANVGSLDASLARLRNELVPKIHQFFIFEESSPAKPVVPSASKSPATFTPTVVPRPVAFPVPRAVVIGVSTGGPIALSKVIPLLPGSFSVPVLVVQHMPPMFTRMLAERLDGQSPLRVVEAEHGMPVKAGTVYLAPGDFHMRVKPAESGQIVTLDQAPAENSCRPAVDVLFRSAAEVFGGALLAVVMTGMGQDGLRGAEVVRAHGGRVVIQDEASSVVWGMPGAVAQAGMADAIVGLDQLAADITKRV